MIERLIRTVLDDGIEHYTDNVLELERHFRVEHRYTTDEVDAVTSVFTTTPPTTVINWPRLDASFPVFAIVIGKDEDAINAFDDYASMIDDDVAEEFGDMSLSGRVARASIAEMTCHVISYAPHPDVCAWNYYISKMIIRRFENVFKEAGFLGLTLSGRDLAPEKAFEPEWLCRRQLAITTKAEQYVLDDRIDRVRTIEGAHVDEDVVVTGVKTNIDVVPE